LLTNLLGVAVTFTNGQIVNLAGVAATITSITGIAATINRIVSAATSFSQLQVSGISTFTNGPVFIGSGTTTGTANQKLQVTGGAYVSGEVGIGTAVPRRNLGRDWYCWCSSKWCCKIVLKFNIILLLIHLTLFSSNEYSSTITF
jgi:hypothetical protein